MIKLLAFSGSTRRDSFNKKILKIAVSAAETKGAEITLLDLKDYPLAFYDGDLEQEKGLPENAIKLKEIIKNCKRFSYRNDTKKRIGRINKVLEKIKNTCNKKLKKN